MKTKLIYLILLLLVSFSKAQTNKYLKIDSLGYHIGEENKGAIIEIPGKSSAEIYKELLNYINKTYKNPDEVIKAQTQNSYLRFEFVDYNMAFFKRAWVNINIGGKTSVEIDVKDGKVRISSITPTLYVNADDIANRQGFYITGGMSTNSLYNKKLKPKKEMTKGEVKSQLENYYNLFIENIISFISETKKNDW